MRRREEGEIFRFIGFDYRVRVLHGIEESGGKRKTRVVSASNNITIYIYTIDAYFAYVMYIPPF